MSVRFFLLVFGCLILPISAFADLISKIEVNGNKRFSNETIILFSDLKINQNYNENNLNSSLKKT